MERDIQKGERIETMCKVHGWGDCACTGPGPWLFERAGSDNCVHARHATKEQTLSAHVTIARRWRRG